MKIPREPTLHISPRLFTFVRNLYAIEERTWIGNIQIWVRIWALSFTVGNLGKFPSLLKPLFPIAEIFGGHFLVQSFHFLVIVFTLVV